jgi:hypothetical protein
MPHSIKYGASKAEDMGRTLNALRYEDLGLNAVARIYSIPEATLRRQFDCKDLRAIHKKSLQHQRHSPRYRRGTERITF